MTAKHYFTALLATGTLIAMLLVAFWTQPAHSETQLLFGNEQSSHRITYEDICG